MNGNYREGLIDNFIDVLYEHRGFSDWWELIENSEVDDIYDTLQETLQEWLDDNELDPSLAE